MKWLTVKLTEKQVRLLWSLADSTAEVTEDRGIERDCTALAKKLRRIGWPS
jgi:hypothetical protein